MKEDINVTNVAPEADVLERSVLFIVQLIKKNLKKIFFAGFLGGVLSFAGSYLLPKKYTSKAEILPEYKESRFSGFSSLANLAGIDMANTSESDAIRPDLYPNILLSTPTILYLLNQPVQTVNKEKFASFLAYLEKANEKKTVYSGISTALKQASILNFNKDEVTLIKSIKSSITTNFDKKTGIIYISVEMRDPVVAAEILSYSIQYLKDFVSDYRANKKHDQSVFIKSRVDEATVQLKNAEYALQRYRDNNRNVIMNVAKIEEQKLQSNYMHAQSLRNDLLNQLEKTVLAEKQGQPIIQVLEPPVISTIKSSPSRIIFAIAGAFLVGLITVIVLAIKNNN